MTLFQKIKKLFLNIWRRVTAWFKCGCIAKNIAFFLIILLIAEHAWASPGKWQREWPHTDFSKSSIEFSEIISGGPPKDGIPAIDVPKFKPVAAITNIGEKEPVTSLTIGQDARAYPLRIMMWHEIVNDTVGSRPVTVTYCPLCNSAIVFDRRVNGKILDFGVSGKLRHSDMVMYDRQTESWWQQITGTGIVGEMTGTKLTRLPARVIPFGSFRSSHPNGQVLVANNPNARRYGQNPYVRYDSSANPFLYRGRYDGPGDPLSYVVAVKDQAWLLSDLRDQKTIQHGNIILSWQSGMNSALDNKDIQKGRDIGFVRVQEINADGSRKNIPYDTSFAFAFKAFYPDGTIHRPSD